MKNPRLRNVLRGFFVVGPRLMLLGALVFIFWSCPDAGASDWSPLIDRLIADGLAPEKINALFSRPEVTFESEAMASKLQVLIRKKFQKPSAVAPSAKAIYAGYLKAEVISGAREYLERNTPTLQGIRENYCVPKEIIVSIMLIETKLGESVGSRSALNTLASMALCKDLGIIQPYLPEGLVTDSTEDFARRKCREKSDWAYRELKAFLEYAEKSGVDPVTIPGSIYGAIGLCQFMPSNAFIFGIDADGDGRIDLFATPDALHSIANYLKKNGWKCKMSKKNQHKVILSYNKSQTYANTILAVAEKLRTSQNIKRTSSPQ
jgi:membrane-bound lytic murein transglycosylase B